MTDIFISYSRKNEAEVKRLVRILERMRHSVHYDQDHSGGHVWWDAILADIRVSKLFILVLSYDYLDSFPCSLEYQYALALNKLILPVMVSHVDFGKVPMGISRLNIVNFTKSKDENQLLDLSGAITELDKHLTSPLPNPLPLPPEAPIPRVSILLEEITDPGVELTPSQQETLSSELLDLYLKPDSRENARFALKKLRERPELRAQHIERINRMLAPRSQRVVWLIALATIVILLAIIGFIIANGNFGAGPTVTVQPTNVVKAETSTNTPTTGLTDTPFTLNNPATATIAEAASVTVAPVDSDTKTPMPTLTNTNVPTTTLNVPEPVTATNSSPDSQTTVTEFGTGSRHISFWNGLTGSDGEIMRNLIANFVQERPDISITMETTPWNALYEKLQAAFVAGQPPDVFMLRADEIPQFSSYGVLKDLSGWYSSGGGWLPGNDISPITRASMDYQGVTYGIPLDNHGRGLWINKDAFKKAGVDPEMSPPTTYEGWVDLFQKLTFDKNGRNAADPAFDPANVQQWGFTVGEWSRVNFLAALVQNGGSFASEDGKTITVNSEAGVKALQQLVDLVYKYHVSPPEAGFDTWQGFAAGSVAVLPTGTWFRNYAAILTDIDSAAWPNFQFGATKAAYMGIHTFMVPAIEEGENLAAVEVFVKWVSDNQKGWADSGQAPARLSAQAALNPAIYPSTIIIGKSLAEYGVPDYQSTAIQEMLTAIDPELSAALNSQKTAKQALDDAAARMQQALDRANAGV